MASFWRGVETRAYPEIAYAFLEAHVVAEKPLALLQRDMARHLPGRRKRWIHELEFAALVAVRDDPAALPVRERLPLAVGKHGDSADAARRTHRVVVDDALVGRLVPVDIDPSSVEDVGACRLGVRCLVEDIPPRPLVVLAGTIRAHPELVVLPAEVVLPLGADLRVADRRRKQNHSRHFALLILTKLTAHMPTARRPASAAPIHLSVTVT